jgi:hypothetical protein
MLRTSSLGFRSATEALNARTANVNSYDKFDIFLSHSFKDASLILGIANELESHGVTVYIDWIVDRQLDRSKVTASTASLLRKRMGQCGSLIYANSTATPSSKWMPWELGYFDGSKLGPISIMPIDEDEPGSKGQEYLGLYPAIEKLPVSPGRYVVAAIRPGRSQWKPVFEFTKGVGQYHPI